MNQKFRQTLTTWLVVYPVTTSLIVLLEPVVSGWVLPLKTLLLTSIMVPLMVLWAMPFATSLFHRFLEPSETAASGDC